MGGWGNEESFSDYTVLYALTFVNYPNGGGADANVPDDGREDLGWVDVANTQSTDAWTSAKDVKGHDRPLVSKLTPVCNSGNHGAL